MIEIKNVKVYGLSESILRSRYPMEMGIPNDMYCEDMPEYIPHEAVIKELKQMKIASSLGSCKQGTGHDNFLNGIIVQYDLKYPQYFSMQLQRYHFNDFISSQSKMNTITKRGSIEDDCNEWVDEEIILIVNKWIQLYNNFDSELQRLKDIAWNSGANTLFGEAFGMYPADKLSVYDYKGELQWYSKKDIFMKIISNLPMGFILWAGFTTNYRQLKTIYLQRKNHKLPEWSTFCNWIRRLPYFDKLVLGEGVEV